MHDQASCTTCASELTIISAGNAYLARDRLQAELEDLKMRDAQKKDRLLELARVRDEI